MSPTLVTFTSSSDSNFERSNISHKENKRNGFDYSVRKKENSMVFGRLKEQKVARNIKTVKINDYARDGGPGEV